MEEVLKLVIGGIILFLGIPIGNYLRGKTLDEMEDGKKWFGILTYLGLSIGLVALIFRIDWLMFSTFFISIVSSRSLIRLKN